jgi:methionyl-tRNA formyltransferase
VLRVVFFGTEYSVLDALRLHAKVEGVYVPAGLPPAPRDGLLRFLGLRRKRRVEAVSALPEETARRSLRPLVGRDVRDPGLLRTVEGIAPDLGVIANFREILPVPLLRAARLGFVNLHPSLLPRYPGAAPLAAILRSGDAESGATWHRAGPRPDEGEVLARGTFPLAGIGSEKELGRRSVALGIDLLPDLLRDLERA